jgi:uncharacterized protein YgiM (DUF1202 family)
MNLNGFLNQFHNSSQAGAETGGQTPGWRIRSQQLAPGTPGLTWVGLFLFAFGLWLIGCQVEIAQTPSPRPPADQRAGLIILEPFAGEINSLVTVKGQNWPANAQLVVAMTIGGVSYSIAAPTVGADGQFSAAFVVPDHPGFKTQRMIPIVASVSGGDSSAQAFFNVIDPADPTATPVLPTPTPLPTPTAANIPTPSPTLTPSPAATPTPEPTATPTSTPTPVLPIAIISTNGLNVRSGPGVAYPAIGLAVSGQEFEILGQNGGWWLVRYPGQTANQGWISGDYVTTQHVDNVQIVVAPPPPAPTPTFTSMPTPTTARVCTPGEWSGCGGRPPAVMCLAQYVSQCGADGVWGQCIWDPGFCGKNYDNDNDNGNDNDQDEDDENDNEGDDDDDEDDDDRPDDDDTDDDDDDT